MTYIVLAENNTSNIDQAINNLIDFYSNRYEMSDAIFKYTIAHIESEFNATVNDRGQHGAWTLTFNNQSDCTNFILTWG